MRISILTVLFIFSIQVFAQTDSLDRKLAHFYLSIPINLHPNETRILLDNNSFFEVTTFENYDDFGNSNLEATYNGNYPKYPNADSVFFKRKTFPVRSIDLNKKTQVKIISQSTLQLIFKKRKSGKEQFDLILEQMSTELPVKEIKQGMVQHKDFNSLSVFLKDNDEFDYISISFRKLKDLYEILIINH